MGWRLKGSPGRVGKRFDRSIEYYDLLDDETNLVIVKEKKGIVENILKHINSTVDL